MILDLDHTVAIPRRAAVLPRLTLTGESDADVPIHAGGDRHLALDLFLGDPLAAALLALVADDTPAASARRAGGLKTEHAGRLHDLPPTSVPTWRQPATVRPVGFAAQPARTGATTLWVSVTRSSAAGTATGGNYLPNLRVEAVPA
jgi:hypothetical protein